MQRSKIALFLLFFGLASLCHAETAMVPSWLPADQRFEVEGTSNEIAQVDHTLALMRDALHPKLKAQMKPKDLGPTLNWIVHVSLPAMTNEAVYFDSYKKPLPLSALSHGFLTNRAARLSIVPVMLDFHLNASVRPEPGVDYPGIDREDDDSFPRGLRITLRAPREKRRFPLRFNVRPNVGRVKIQSVRRGNGVSFHCSSEEMQKGKALMLASQPELQKRGESVLMIFGRVDNGYWGPPAVILVSADPLCTHHYAAGKIASIDYGDFSDRYDTDREGRIMGFERIRTGLVRGNKYSNMGEMILESYPNDAPKVTQKVVYSVTNGRLNYTTAESKLFHKYGQLQFRPDYK